MLNQIINDFIENKNILIFEKNNDNSEYPTYNVKQTPNIKYLFYIMSDPNLTSNPDQSTLINLNTPNQLTETNQNKDQPLLKQLLDSNKQLLDIKTQEKRIRLYNIIHDAILSRIFPNVVF